MRYLYNIYNATLPLRDTTDSFHSSTSELVEKINTKLVPG